MQHRKKCKICNKWHNPKYNNVEWCSPDCGAKYAIKLRQKEKIKKKQRRKEEAQRERRNLKVRKLAVKPLKYFHDQAQSAFNEYIRTRDSADPCISCGRFHDGQWHAGHYLTVGHITGNPIRRNQLP